MCIYIYVLKIASSAMSARRGHPLRTPTGERPHIYVYIYLYKYFFIYMYIHIYIYVYIYVKIYLYIYIYIYIYMYIYIYTYVYRYIYIYTYICIHTCISSFSAHWSVLALAGIRRLAVQIQAIEKDDLTVLACGVQVRCASTTSRCVRCTRATPSSHSKRLVPEPTQFRAHLMLSSGFLVRFCYFSVVMDPPWTHPKMAKISGSNFIRRRTRPGLAGLRPRRNPRLHCSWPVVSFPL